MPMIRPLIASFALLLALGGAGCAKRASTSAESPGSYGGEMAEMDYGKDASYAEMEMAPTAAPAPPPAEPAPMDDESSANREVAAGPARSSAGGIAPGGQGTPTAKPAPVVKAADKSEPKSSSGGDEDGGDEPQKPIARQIIYTAEMALSVFNLDESMQRVEAIALAAGGYVQSMSAGYYVVRIPAANLRSVMNGVGGLGLVTSRSLQARDVTEEFVDVNTRIRVLRETQLQLIDLLKKARTVEEALHVRQALDQVTMELERALGRLRMLESLIGFSTLTVRLEERGPQNRIPSSNDPFPWVDELGVEATEWN